MPDELHTAVNNSTSKAMFSFSKSDRFPIQKTLNKTVAYNTYDLFGKNKDNGGGRPFHHTTKRFNYYGSPDKSGKLPSPFNYQLGDTFGKESRQTNEQYSFGVGRDDMKKQFVDEIKKKGDHSLPGPGKYYKDPLKFGSDDLHKFSNSMKFSCAQKLPTDEQALGRSKKLPGPGYYEFAEVTGKPLVQSHIPTENKFSFGKAHDRWYPPTRKVPAPGPDKYRPQNNLNENFYSIYNQSQQTKIGQNNSSIIDQHYNMQKKTPGPGAYQAFSDFSGLQNANK